MAIVTEISWDDMLDGKPVPETPARKAWREAVEEIAEKARTKLPECNGRVNSAVKIVLAGDVELMADGTAKVASQSNGTTAYHVVNGHCDCRDYDKAPYSFCKHRLSAAIVRRAQDLTKARLTQLDQANHGTSAPPAEPAQEPAAPDTPRPDELPGLPEVLKPFMTHLHGKVFVRYAGLLALAHERGLAQLTARVEFHSEVLVLASATATFSDGRVFTEWADAMPGNVGAQVRPHWVRMALTRAKARCLRDALNIGLTALEELDAE